MTRHAAVEHLARTEGRRLAQLGVELFPDSSELAALLERARSQFGET